MSTASARIRAAAPEADGRLRSRMAGSLRGYDAMTIIADERVLSTGGMTRLASTGASLGHHGLGARRQHP